MFYPLCLLQARGCFRTAFALLSESLAASLVCLAKARAVPSKPAYVVTLVLRLLLPEVVNFPKCHSSRYF